MTPACPRCGSSEHVERVRCLCFACPQWTCTACAKELAQRGRVDWADFYADEEDD